MHIHALMSTPTSVTTGATQVRPQLHPLVRTQMHRLVHLYIGRYDDDPLLY